MGASASLLIAADDLVAQFGAGLVDLLLLARDDIDPGAARFEQAFHDHAPDPAAAAGDQHDLAFETEKVGEFHHDRNPFFVIARSRGRRGNP